jgi:hypothetical protein
MAKLILVSKRSCQGTAFAGVGLVGEGQKFVESADGMAIDDSGEHVGEMG